ncbi:MAG: type VI secretion protein, partial [Pseudonocardiaceae bacterium]
MPAWILAAHTTDDPPVFRAAGIALSGRTGGWVGDYLRDPAGVLLAVLRHLAEWVITCGPIVGPLLAVGVAALLGARWWWARRRHTRLTVDARMVTVLTPPTVDPAGGQALWSHLVGLLRPAWRRWLSGQPHLACEYVFSEAGVSIRLW